MKLPNVTRGPVTLSKIDYAANMSEETTAFTAIVTINGQSSPVRNDGRGGCNIVSLNPVWQALQAHAATLPPEPTEHGPLTMTADFLLSLMVEDAIRAHEHKKMAKKGFTHVISAGSKALYCVGAPTDAIVRKHFGDGKVQITALAS